MYLIQCPAGHSFPVPAKAAGSVATCPNCGATINVPKLGELRNLPVAQEISPTKEKGSTSMGVKVAFAVFMLIAIGTGLTSAFAAFRWFNIPVPFTQAEHIEEETKTLSSYSPAQLVSVWEHLETIGLGEPQPLPYQFLQDLKDHWRNVCLTSLGITIGSVAIAVAIVGLARFRKLGADT